MRERSAVEVFIAFLKLGLTAFGGPVAHLGYFRKEFVVRRRWIDDAAYSELVALCQFLPGPASSQVGFSLGLIRAGYWGALAAWTGFTLPSAVLMTVFALSAGDLTSPMGVRAIHGLKLVAVAIVAQAVWGMARTLCPDRRRASIACGTAVIVLYDNSSLAQVGVILSGAMAGLVLCRFRDSASSQLLRMPVSRLAGMVALGIFVGLLVLLPALAARYPAFVMFDAFYRTGALVFGGGHVVLPILSEALVAPGLVSQDSFLAGYGAAQALPGPLFTIAAYLGLVAKSSPSGMAGAAVGTVGIFLPGILVLVGSMPFWNALRQRAGAQAAMRGINAAVVGLLCAALYSFLWVRSVQSAGDFAVALIGFALLTVYRVPPLLVVFLMTLGSEALT